MPLKTYIGARYAPKFMGKWNNTTKYEPLSVVYWNNNSYVSKTTVPAGTPVTVEKPDGEFVTNSAYWILSSDWNAQVAEYQQTVEQYRDEAVKQTAATNQYRKDTQNFFEVTMHSYNTEEEMKIDSTVKVGYTLVTCGKNAIGDGGGRYFKVVEETSSDAIAIAGGLWAKPFNITLPEESWTELNLTPDDTDVINITNMVSGGRYIAKTEIGLQPGHPLYGVDIPNASTLNNVQLILPFISVPDEEYEIQFSPALGKLKIYFSLPRFNVRVKIDNGRMTFSDNDMSKYLTEKDKKDIERKISNQTTALNTYKESNNNAVSQKLNKDIFETYKNAKVIPAGINYRSNATPLTSRYEMDIHETNHFQFVSASFRSYPSPKPTVAKLAINFTPTDFGHYCGLVKIAAATEGLTITNHKDVYISFANWSSNQLHIDLSSTKIIGYIGIVGKVNERESENSFYLFDATLDINDALNDKLNTSDFNSFKKQYDLKLQDKVNQQLYDEFVQQTNGTLDTKVAQTDFDSYKESNDREVALKANKAFVNNIFGCEIFPQYTGTTGDGGTGEYTFDFFKTFVNPGMQNSNAGYILKNETLSTTSYNFNIEFGCPTTPNAYPEETITVSVPKKTGLSSAGIYGLVKVTARRADHAQFETRVFKITLSDQPVTFRVTFMPSVEPTDSIILFTANVPTEK